ncbi:iron chelate uptake ABC transporter family permease subunit, partial [uncultured Rhodococcus sp.]|uniref:iron chelate uptake ABC transporter family permease subunit n=1 Tax=uncultured Rhodococcus sp. TaxID=194249 RepID=UPI0028DC5B7C
YIDDAKMRADLAAGKVVIVAGFQGVDAEGNITTLGRGGSDTSAVALAAIATAAAGPVGFVALAAPQVAMRLVRSAGPPIVASALTGAVLVVGSDVIARTILPVELPVGIVTSALGGPFLLYLLVRNNRKVTA